jgi:hypothetical protein
MNMEKEYRGILEAWYYSTEKNHDGTAKLIKYSTNTVKSPSRRPTSEAFARRYKSLIFDRAPHHPLNAFIFW